MRLPAHWMPGARYRYCALVHCSPTGWGGPRRPMSGLAESVLGMDMVDALDPEGTEIRVLDSLCRLPWRDVLEIGTGNGRLTWRYAERVASVVGLEPDEGRVARAKAATPAALRDRVVFRHADVATVDLPASAFDVVLFSWSI